MEPYETAITFETPGEAAAFMKGFHMAASEHIFARIDPEEPQTVLLDIATEEAMDVYLRVAVLRPKGTT